ncbi:ISAs1 family transposase [Dactylosporangium sp. NPDC049525]|uniref:ISAs1 family transposase n=1 Tax=Dactylosporangium sp. NPDC049525 TaxID=3154730 RepID=UPI0034499343
MQALDPDLLAAAIGAWLATRIPAPAAGTRQAIAVDGKTLRGSRTRGHTARHVLAAVDQHTGIALASTDVDTKTSEITRFHRPPRSPRRPARSRGDRRRAALPTRPRRLPRQARRTLILTVKGNQPSLHQQLAGLPWRLVPVADRATDRGHGRREIRTLKILSVSTGIDFPNAAQAIQIRRRRRRLDEPRRFTTETVHAITDLLAHQAKPFHLADWIRGHWSIENKVHWVRDVTYDEDRSQIRTGTGPQVMAAIRNAAIGAFRLAGATDIASATRHHARDANRPLALLCIT